MALEMDEGLELMFFEEERRPRTFQDEDFQKMVQRNLPSWTSLWNSVIQFNVNQKIVTPVDFTFSFDEQNARTELQNRFREKLAELLQEEELLMELYRKAAETVKNKGKELQLKIKKLKIQIQKDKNLMKTLEELY